MLKLPEGIAEIRRGEHPTTAPPPRHFRESQDNGLDWFLTILATIPTAISHDAEKLSSTAWAGWWVLQSGAGSKQQMTSVFPLVLAKT